MNGRVLIVEDEDLIARSIGFALDREGFATEIARDGRAALEAARTHPPDVVILDLVLPGDISGMDVCSILRAESAVPIIIVSARDSEIDRVLGLERGADDYVVKPFSMAELLGRVRAQLRRRDLDHAGGGDPVRRVGGLTIHLLRREVTADGEPVHVTPSEFLVLELLSGRAGEVVSRREIVAALWSSDFVGAMRACDAHISRLRQKIERDPRRPRRILSVRGTGYKLVADAPGS